MRWRESDGVRWLEPELLGTPGPRSRPGSAGSARSPSRASTSACSPTTTATPWSRTASGSPPRSASTRTGSRSAARSTAPSWPFTPRRRSRARSRSPAAPSSPRSTATSSIEPGLAPLVFVADCLPVALAGPGGVAMLHCGWRGLAAGIVARGRRGGRGDRRRRSVPGSGPAATRSARRCSARSPASGRESPRADARPARGRPPAARATPGSSEVESAGLCTSCEAELFFSHRRDAGRTGRQAGLAWIDGRRLSDAGPDPRPRPGEDRRQPRAGPRDRRRPASRSSSPTKYVPLEEMGALAEAGVDPGRREPPAGPRAPSTSAGATPSSGTSSATCRAAR